MTEVPTRSELLAQRDALAGVVAMVWETVQARWGCSPHEAAQWMTDAGLIEQHPATEDEADRLLVELGEPAPRLSALGQAAMEGVKR
jgi:hypothetical protein